ncbi:unnamed protein product [Caenorhabditis auriculariae]|uniref:Uncharacterized protein n=1 Tax=Caenorhabditis auriculariae TaxID=2777116 RepID=A0A8S1GMF1_9PELO|nr:unnamed protein product [Caenorhabditis auriculariae]
MTLKVSRNETRGNIIREPPKHRIEEEKVGDPRLGNPLVLGQSICTPRAAHTIHTEDTRLDYVLTFGLCRWQVESLPHSG